MPKDQALFNQFVQYLSIGLAHQANIAAVGTTFICLKQRELFVSYLQPIVLGTLKQALLASPTSFSSTLFDEAEVSSLFNITKQSSNLKIKPGHDRHSVIRSFKITIVRVDLRLGHLITLGIRGA